MTSFGWRPGAGRGRPERRHRDDRRSGKDRRAPVVPPPDPAALPRVVRPTPRQVEVLALVAAGKTREQVASALGLSPQTVQNHADAARARLKADNLPQAVAVCIVRGWLVPNRRWTGEADAGED